MTTPACSDLRIQVRVAARAAQNELQGFADGVLRLRTTAPPADGAANKAVIRQLASAFGVAQSAVSIVRGKSSRNKQVLIRNPGKLPACLRDAQRTTGQ